jgi:hypothetical protein
MQAQLAVLAGAELEAAMDGAAEAPVMNPSAENGPSIARGAGSGRHAGTPACTTVC